MNDRIHCMTCGESWPEGTTMRCKCVVNYDIIQCIADESVEYQREIMQLRAQLAAKDAVIAEMRAVIMRHANPDMLAHYHGPLGPCPSCEMAAVMAKYPLLEDQKINGKAIAEVK